MGPFTASHGFREQFIQKFVQSVHGVQTGVALAAMVGFDPDALIDSARAEKSYIRIDRLALGRSPFAESPLAAKRRRPLSYNSCNRR